MRRGEELTLVTAPQSRPKASSQQRVGLGLRVSDLPG